MDNNIQTTYYKKLCKYSLFGDNVLGQMVGKFNPKYVIGQVMDALAEHDNNQKLKSYEVDTYAKNEDKLLWSITWKK